MKARNTTLKLITLIALVTIATSWSVASASASLNSTRSTGMFGITQNQTARLSVANIDDGSFVPCIRVELSFVDSDGNILSQKVHEVESGKSAFLDLRGNEIAQSRSNRSQIRAIARFVGTPDTRLYMWLPTLEVFDNESGETRFLLPAVQKVQKVQE